MVRDLDTGVAGSGEGGGGGSKIDRKIGNAILASRYFEQQLPRGPNPVPSRSASPVDVYDDENQWESPFHGFAAGTIRPMWRVPDVAISHTPVNTLQTSGNSVTTQTGQIFSGVASSVKAPSAGFATMPNMELPIVANGPVQISASASVQSNVASDNVSFAFYRDGQQISQIFNHTTSSAANSPSVVSLSITDSPVAAHGLLGNHVYSLYWKAGTGVLSSNGVQRSLYLVNLVPQG